jgi:hypothetical protein
MDATPSLIELLNEIRDPRRAKGKRHPHPTVLSLLILAMMAGMRGLQGVIAGPKCRESAVGSRPWFPRCDVCGPAVVR